MSVRVRVKRPTPSLAEIMQLLPTPAIEGMVAEVAQRLRNRREGRTGGIGEPHAGPQNIFENETDPIKEMLYGGAAGGGKTEALLRSALKYYKVRGYAAIIWRRTFPMLEGENGLIERSHKWLSGTSGWKWQERTRTWKNRVFGSSLRFAHMQYENDKYTFQGNEHQFEGWDELTQFTRTQYLYPRTWCRRVAVGALSQVPLRIRTTSNPGGRGHFWVKKRFIAPYREICKRLGIITQVGCRLTDAEIRRTLVAIPKNGLGFIQAFASDNPSLDRGEFDKMLLDADDISRRQMREGDWDAEDEGQLLTSEAIMSCYAGGCLWSGLPAAGALPELYIGVDIGRTSNRTVVYVWELIGDVAWTRKIIVMHNQKFDVQKAEIIKWLSLRGVVKTCVDKGAIGMQLAEELSALYPGMVEGVQLTAGRQGQIAQLMSAAFAQKRVRIPSDDPELDEDLQLVQKTEVRQGIPVVVETEGGPSGHADRFWAAGLGLFAMPKIMTKPRIASADQIAAAHRHTKAGNTPIARGHYGRR